jgi:hypothetical protein
MVSNCLNLCKFLCAFFTYFGCGSNKIISDTDQQKHWLEFLTFAELSDMNFYGILDRGRKSALYTEKIKKVSRAHASCGDCWMLWLLKLVLKQHSVHNGLQFTNNTKFM